MPLFKKKNKKNSIKENKNNSQTKSKDYEGFNTIDTNNKVKKTDKKDLVVKKKKKLGFKKKKSKVDKKQPDIDEIKEDFNNTTAEQEPIEPYQETEEPEKKEEIKEKKTFSKKHKKAIIKKDMKGKPVFLEDTGEKLGTVFDSIYDKDKRLVGFKIKDNKTDAVISFPSEQFDESKEGLVFVPGWYTNALRTIEKLEFKDKISPDLTALLTDNTISHEELYDIFIKHDDDMAQFIDDAVALKEMLTNRLKMLEKQRIALKENLMDLTEKRLIKDIDRREFSEDVMNHRRKVNILDVNIGKCKDLIKRLDTTSFGVLGTNYLIYDKTPDFENKNYISEEKTIQTITATKDDIYKEKYYALKEQYEQLEDNYQELKSAVDKLVNKD